MAAESAPTTGEEFARRYAGRRVDAIGIGRLIGFSTDAPDLVFIEHERGLCSLPCWPISEADDLILVTTCEPGLRGYWERWQDCTVLDEPASAPAPAPAPAHVLNPYLVRDRIVCENCGYTPRQFFGAPCVCASAPRSFAGQMEKDAEVDGAISDGLPRGRSSTPPNPIAVVLAHPAIGLVRQR